MVDSGNTGWRPQYAAALSAFATMRVLMSPAIPLVDLALRAGIASLMLFGAALLLRDHARSITVRLGAACGLGVAAYALQALPGFVAQPAGWKLPLVALSTGNAIVFWACS